MKFRTLICGSVEPNPSKVRAMAKGMKVDDAYEITRKDVAKELDHLPLIKPLLQKQQLTNIEVRQIHI